MGNLKMNYKTIVITGSNGSTAKGLIRYFSNHFNNVIGISRDPHEMFSEKNVFYNVFLADKLEILNKLSALDNNTADMVKDKIRSEIKSGLEKDRILSNEDAILIKKFIKKITSELK